MTWSNDRFKAYGGTVNGVTATKEGSYSNASVNIVNVRRSDGSTITDGWGDAIDTSQEYATVWRKPLTASFSNYDNIYYADGNPITLYYGISAADQGYSKVYAGKNETTYVSYTFTGWSPALTDKIYGDTTYVAQYNTVYHGKVAINAKNCKLSIGSDTNALLIKDESKYYYDGSGNGTVYYYAVFKGTSGNQMSVNYRAFDGYCFDNNTSLLLKTFYYSVPNQTMNTYTIEAKCPYRFTVYCVNETSYPIIFEVTDTTTGETESYTVGNGAIALEFVTMDVYTVTVKCPTLPYGLTISLPDYYEIDYADGNVYDSSVYTGNEYYVYADSRTMKKLNGSVSTMTLSKKQFKSSHNKLNLEAYFYFSQSGTIVYAPKVASYDLVPGESGGTLNWELKFDLINPNSSSMNYIVVIDAEVEETGETIHKEFSGTVDDHKFLYVDTSFVAFDSSSSSTTYTTQPTVSSYSGVAYFVDSSGNTISEIKLI